ncbi:MAG: electron transporter RnfA [Planctomycetes bacterium DG_58]|nr:MAG: electron transporter RnfA [Planctomycetes bacterium DG_58]KPL03293.1 MAG: electron transporter RnfA [Planctomycetes bacterium SM23_65]
MTKYFLVIISMVFVQNYVLARFLGLCPFINVSRKTDAALGMGMAVTFVMTMTSAVTWPLYFYVLELSERNVFVRLGWLELTASQPLVAVLKVSSYILVIASLVQLVEMFLRKTVPALYRALGIFLPLITTNCAIMGVALLNTTNYPGPGQLSFFGAVWQGFWAGIGFTVVMLLMSGIRERLESARVPKAMADIPIAFVCTGLMAVAFMGFTGIVR